VKLIPAWLLRRLYNRNSLRNVHHGVRFCLKNRLTDGKVNGISELLIDGKAVPLESISLALDDEASCTLAQVRAQPLNMELGSTLHVQVKGLTLSPGLHQLDLTLECTPLGTLRLVVEDELWQDREESSRIPRDRDDDYNDDIIASRRLHLRQRTQTEPHHIFQPSFDSHLCRGNIEHFIGVAQVPLGLAGPLRVNGEHATGEFLIPLATTEGTLVASYNRGMKLLNQSGGVTCTVVGDNMQRAPVFVFESARGGRKFVDWVVAHLDPIRDAAESTSSVARLKHIDYTLSNRFAYLRFNFTTGDAAGQNMVGKATFAACNWILENYESGQILKFFLESNFATDKKASMINTMRTRGKRVTAEATIPRQLLVDMMGVEPRVLHYHNGVANVGAFLAGANNNGLHSANAITAMFIATGQDVANVAESSAGLVYTELTEDQDLYISITLPSLIVATHGGGTGLPTQRECLEILGCYGKGKVLKLAEIVAGCVLAGELSLASAISSLDWVASHEEFGRNR